MKTPKNYPEPTQEDLNNPLFEQIWQAIKGWDIKRHNAELYAGATGNDVCHILQHLQSFSAKLPDEEVKRIAKDTSYWISCIDGIDRTIRIKAAIEQAIHSALSLVRGGDAWQPIESAPKDGTEVLFLRKMPYSDGGNMCIGFWHHYQNEPSFIANCGGVISPAIYTHWMPLPTPPDISTAIGKETK